jgi:hypothetical protein
LTTIVIDAVVSSLAVSWRSDRMDESAGKAAFTVSSAWVMVSADAGAGTEAGG